jgi:lipopolysaccharide transport system ATP-binding protein
MSSEPAIYANGLSKAYLIYSEPTDRLRQAIIPRLQRLAQPVAKVAGKHIRENTYFSQHWALHPLDFSVARGETLGVVGRNGSGKSTLLQLVCGTLTPTSGDVKVRGRIAALLELGSGFNPEYTGRENVFLNASVLGLSREETVARLDDILAFADIGDFVDQPVRTYSSGMAMRLAFAVIAHVDADILVVDEALAVGDAYFQQKCMRWLRQFRQTGTVLFCGHDTSAVLNLCDRALWLDKGSVAMEGTAKEVCEGYIASINSQAMGIPNRVDRITPKKSSPGEARNTEKSNDDVPKSDSMVTTGSLNQIVRIMELDPRSSEYGSGDAEVTSVSMERPDGTSFELIHGGEQVLVTVRVRANTEIQAPFIGFFVKDRLGQALFGDNTFLTCADQGLTLDAGENAVGRFRFALPLLLTGSYTITAAIASGSLQQPVIHHWLHDALVFEVHSPLLNGVMVGIPMTHIQFLRVDSASSI